MTDTVEVPDEAVRLAGEAAEDAAMRWLGRDLGTLHRDDIARDALAAAVPLLRAQWERERRGKVHACTVNGQDAQHWYDTYHDARAADHDHKLLADEWWSHG